MNNRAAMRILFYVAGVYDGILGVAFLFKPLTLFERFAVIPPNHVGYVQFPAALLIIFALMCFAIARDAVKNMNLIPYAMLLKVAYCSVVLLHWLGEGVPNIWKPFVVFDALFLVLFAWAYLCIKRDTVTAN